MGEGIFVKSPVKTNLRGDEQSLESSMAPVAGPAPAVAPQPVP